MSRREETYAVIGLILAALSCIAAWLALAPLFRRPTVVAESAPTSIQSPSTSMTTPVPSLTTELPKATLTHEPPTATATPEPPTAHQHLL